MIDPITNRDLADLVQTLDTTSLELERSAEEENDAATDRALVHAAATARAAAEELQSLRPEAAMPPEDVEDVEDGEGGLQAIFKRCLARLPFGPLRDLVIRRYLDVRSALDDVEFRRSCRTADRSERDRRKD